MTSRFFSHKSVCRFLWFPARFTLWISVSRNVAEIFNSHRIRNNRTNKKSVQDTHRSTHSKGKEEKSLNEIVINKM